MRILTLICLAVALALRVSAQSPSAPQLSEDPRSLLINALPLYDFSGAEMKPWHIKGTYQLYDLSGQPAQQGTYESWRASPKVYRSTWTRADATRSEWHTSDGKTVYKSTGDRLLYVEHKLDTFLFSPVPNPANLDRADFDLKADELKIGKLRLPCAEIEIHHRPDGTMPFTAEVLAGNYCFDPLLPVLRIRQFDSIDVEFNKLTKTQNRVLARQITVMFGRNKLLTLDLDMPEALSSADAPLTPPADAIPSPEQENSSTPLRSLIVKKVPPSYPSVAKTAGISGSVILDAMIGADGRVRDMRVLGSPSPLLTSASMEAVSLWQYQPFIVDGHAEEVNTIIRVIFLLGR